MKVVNMQLWLVVFSFYASLASGKRKIRFSDTTVDSRCSNCFRQILRISEIQIFMWVSFYFTFSKAKAVSHLEIVGRQIFSADTVHTGSWDSDTNSAKNNLQIVIVPDK